MLVRSIFEHCSVVWRPTSPCVIKKFEIIQRRATKWIYSQPYVSYDDDDYLIKLKKLDILPMGYKFLVTDLLLFHRIVYSDVCIGLPSYLSLIIPVSRNAHQYRLRKRATKCTSDIHPLFHCSLKPIEQDENDPLLFKCNFKPRTKVNESTFFIRSFQEWNKIPLYIRIDDTAESFQDKLKQYIWELLRENIGRDEWPD